MSVGDIVLIRYEGKCKPGTYRLGVVREVQKSEDGLVRTVTVEYSLIGEVPAAERHLYTGITKKKISLPVQRLVLILPFEEQEFLPGGQADQASAPHHEVVTRDGSSGEEVKSVVVGGSFCMRSRLSHELALYMKSYRVMIEALFVGVQDWEKDVYEKFFGDGYMVPSVVELC